MVYCEQRLARRSDPHPQSVRRPEIASPRVKPRGSQGQLVGDGSMRMYEQLSVKNSKIAGCSWLFFGRRDWEKRGCPRQTSSGGCFSLHLSARSARRRGLFAVGNRGPELFEPDLCRGVGGGTPV